MKIYKLFLYIGCFFLATGCVKEYKKIIYKRIKLNGKYVATGIHFDKSKASLKQESMKVINAIAEVMIDYPKLRLSVEGHTDSDGEDNFNQKLSEERAKTVRKQLIMLGIDKKRLKSIGWGEKKPITNNNTEENKAKNRRVEFSRY